MKKLITLAAGLLLTTSAFASTVTLHKDAKVFSADFATKTEAVSAGFDISEDLASMAQNDLRFTLPVSTQHRVDSIAIDQTEITIEEFARVRGEVQYRAIVDVDYHFNTVDND